MRALGLMVVALTLTACGQYGDLYLPGAKPALVQEASA